MFRPEGLSPYNPLGATDRRRGPHKLLSAHRQIQIICRQLINAAAKVSSATKPASDYHLLDFWCRERTVLRTHRRNPKVGAKGLAANISSIWCIKELQHLAPRVEPPFEQTDDLVWDDGKMVLVIRKKQFEAFQLDSDVRWYESQLAELYPTFARASNAHRLQCVKGGIKRGLAFGLDRPDFLQYLCFEQTFSQDWMENPTLEWARRVLAEPGRSSAERIKSLRQQSIRYLLEIEARERQALEQRGQEQRDVEEQQEQEQDDEGVGTAAGVDT